MLRKVRIALATVFFLAITVMFLDRSHTLQTVLAPFAKLQFLPAVLAVNIGIIVLILALTLLLGRIYCSVICPLGVYQDVISFLSSRRKGKKARFSYHKEMKILRYGVFVIYVVLILIGANAAVAAIAPYSSYGRFVANIGLRPYWAALAPAAVLILLVSVLAWVNGRAWCNSVCPVGTALSFFSRFAIFRPVIDADKCKNCRQCERKCKASCIDIKNHSVDYSRCVDCFDCVESCKFSALKYKLVYGKSSGAATNAEQSSGAASAAGSRSTTSSSGNVSKVDAVKHSAAGEKLDAGRRAFVGVSAMALGASVLNAQTKKLSDALPDEQKKDGGFAEVLPKQDPERSVPLTPFGSESVKDFYRRCTACQLCVTACPNNILHPSTDFEHFMQPKMSYADGYCRPECTKCSQVCPAGAIKPITPEQKTDIHIGVASVNYDLCVVNRDGVSCGNCARHCPVGAILMVKQNPDDEDSPKIPAVQEFKCIGCGACENLCPSRPISAITVNGLQVHISSEA